MERGAAKLELGPPSIICGCGPDYMRNEKIFFNIFKLLMAFYLTRAVIVNKYSFRYSFALNQIGTYIVYILYIVYIIYSYKEELASRMT